jgi:hypothetical protein
MLVGEETGQLPSLLRLLFLKQGQDPSIVELLIHGGESSLARTLMIETDEKPTSLCRTFFSDTPTGKPSLAKYVFGGEGRGTSLMRLMVQVGFFLLFFGFG